MAETHKIEASVTISGQSLAAPSLAPGLYVVATPIGNLGDISLRALQTLAAVDLILCEDTRHSARLLSHYGITSPRAPLHEHNETARIAGILERLENGAAIALISDAGTPLVSDPGFPLVRAVRGAGHPIIAIPGASALLAGLVVAGLPTDSFSFFGFLPSKAGQRASALEALAGRPETLVFYESPKRLAASLGAMAEAFGADRPAVVALELTKLHERTLSGPLEELSVRFAETPARGEAVILVGGAPDRVPDENAWRADLETAMAAGPLRSAVDTITARYDLPRKKVYDEALALKKQKG